MIKIFTIHLIIVLTNLVILAPKASATNNDPAKISIWKRKTGQHSENRVVGKSSVANLPLTGSKGLTVKIASLTDIHYNKKASYRGVLLADLLRKYQSEHPLSSEDGVLLHFQNKMIIPVKLSVALNKRAKVLFAFETRPTTKSPWLREFTSVSKKDDLYQDPRPLTFHGNKMALNKKTETYLTSKMNQPFSPWFYANSLVGIEYVNLDAYNKQFDLKGDQQVKSGFKVFVRRCQYCHGIRYVGARYGWDFVEPIPIYKKRLKKDLHYHVKYPKAFALQKGLMMPNQLGFSEKEASDLWYWLKAAAKNQPKSYKAN